MARLLTVAAVLAMPFMGQAMEVSATSSLRFDAVAAKNRPVSKVITLLKDMLKQLEKEAEEDEEIYDKMACWCETNDKEKTKSISDAEAKIEDLTTKIEEYTAASARLGTEIKNLEKEVSGNQEALDKATAIREKQLAEFNAEEKDLLQSISALKSAVVVLGKHNAASLIQTQRRTVVSTLSRAMAKHADRLQGVLTPSQRRAAHSFIQMSESDDHFDADPTFKQSYAPQSGEIFGILSQMKETFETNLASSQKDETANQKAYEDLKAAKEEEIKAGQDQIDSKTQEHADTDEKNAQAKEDIEDTKTSLAADEEFLSMLKEKCSMTDGEWEERQKTRQLEMEAVSKALAVLSGDDAHDLFSKTFNFVQTASKAQSERRTAASAVLLQVAKKYNNPRLSTLAMRVKLDAFVRVKKAIQDMIEDLAAEQADEVKHKDFCTEEFNTNQLQTEKKTRAKQDLEATIEDLTMTIKTLGGELDTLKSEIAEMQVQMKRSGEDREKQNKEFQMTVADQRATQKLLKAALTVLQDFYGKAAAAALLQQQESGEQAPPPGFEAYKKNESAGGVMGMIQQIAEDSKAMENEAIRSESDAQAAYEDFVKETNASIETKGKEIVNKSEEKSKSEGDLVQSKEGLESTVMELEQLSNYNAELHQSCDFVMKNFELRQTARSEEMEALKQAKAILSGAKFIQMLQES